MQGVQGLAVSHCLATLNLKQRKGFMADKSIQIKIWVQMQCFISQQNPIKFDCLEEGERAIISLRNGCNFFAVVKRRINLCNQFNCLDCTRNDDNKSTIRAYHKKLNIQATHFYTHPLQICWESFLISASISKLLNYLHSTHTQL